MRKVNDISRSSARYESLGSLALEESPREGFVVYEGGLLGAFSAAGATADVRPDIAKGNAVASVFEEEEVSEAPETLPLRLGQKVAFVLAIAAVVASMLAVSGLSAAAHEAAVARAYSAVPLEQITVREGDTLLGIAGSHPVEGVSSQDLVTLIERQNGLENATITVGQELTVPRAE
ncbi:MAG: LysM peptidoglycan-binding domain-containing protein [Atopobiaceae bacterium]|jgi:hypothetical protein|nr:LysM peptidoglycan-binding domain-containing protein [Atopobiaceae bacterium]MCH4120081.1 LysM peptidoglycan-binding domain-containing protein [Atopobiaceae bacterium]MCI1317885.1 LysM peptidoglycan-binding domain-containing protein [Atopobiaceae bacterium]MCI1388402.1 LysM peptidoglycan-binding domain-containing protein [Atopobiaceae bacterium]MCI1431347.1 LysM peptidoglycan-binding domain-containing protein [Atopobiaceae bacterium]